jgi:hypothetical protein
MLFWRKHFEDGNCPSPRLFVAPYLEFPEFSFISYEKSIEKYLSFEPQTGIKSQIYSQGKLTTLRCENRKIRHKKRNLKRKQAAS